MGNTQDQRIRYTQIRVYLASEQIHTKYTAKYTGTATWLPRHPFTPTLSPPMHADATATAHRSQEDQDTWELLCSERRLWVPFSHETAAQVEYDQQKLGTATTANEAIAALSVDVKEYALPELWKLWAHLADDGRVGKRPFSYVLSAATAWALADQWLGQSASGASIFGAALISLHPERQDQIKQCADVSRLQQISEAASKEHAFDLLCPQLTVS